MSIATELNMDYELMDKQRDELFALIIDRPESILWGVVALLDALINEEEDKRA